MEDKFKNINKLLTATQYNPEEVLISLMINSRI